MKLIIYIVLFILLIIYVKKSITIPEQFINNKEIINDDDFSYYNGTNQYNMFDTNKIKPIFIDSNSTLLPGFDSNSNDTYSSQGKYWEIKSFGFSDIYNYADAKSSSIVLNDIVNLENKPKQFPIIPPLKKNSKNILNQITHNNKKFDLLGLAINEYYNQYYLIYQYLTLIDIENINMNEELKYMDNQVYEYLLVKVDGDKYNIIIEFGPRNKININDVVYLSHGSFQLGPLVIKKIN